MVLSTTDDSVHKGTVKEYSIELAPVLAVLNGIKGMAPYLQSWMGHFSVEPSS